MSPTNISWRPGPLHATLPLPPGLECQYYSLDTLSSPPACEHLWLHLLLVTLSNQTPSLFSFLWGKKKSLLRSHIIKWMGLFSYKLNFFWKVMAKTWLATGWRHLICSFCFNTLETLCRGNESVWKCCPSTFPGLHKNNCYVFWVFFLRLKRIELIITVGWSIMWLSPLAQCHNKDNDG